LNKTTLALFVIILICLPCGSTGKGYESKNDQRNVEKIVMNEEIIENNLEITDQFIEKADIIIHKIRINLK